ncbi:MAG: hypothetical protein R3F11_29865 [Verrucomicrobiales bacterium]
MVAAGKGEFGGPKLEPFTPPKRGSRGKSKNDISQTSFIYRDAATLARTEVTATPDKSKASLIARRPRSDASLFEDAALNDRRGLPIAGQKPHFEKARNVVAELRAKVEQRRGIYFAAAAGVMLALTLFGLLSMVGGDPDSPSIASGSGSGVSAESREKANFFFENDAKELALHFLNAESAEEKARYVRDPELNLPRMKAFYADHPLEKGRFNESALKSRTHIMPGVGLFFESFNVALDNGDPLRMLAAVKTQSGYQIDWECYARYGTMAWDDFVTRQSLAPAEFRVLATPDNYYNYAFQDPSKFICLRLDHMDSTESLYGYVDRSSPEASEIVRAFQQKPIRQLTVALQFPSDSRGGKQVLITGVIAAGWVKPDGAPEIGADGELVAQALADEFATE